MNDNVVNLFKAAQKDETALEVLRRAVEFNPTKVIVIAINEEEDMETTRYFFSGELLFPRVAFELELLRFKLMEEAIKDEQ